MSSHEALTRAVVGTGRKLVQAGHFAARDVAARVQQLEDAMGRLRAEAAQRRRRLQQAQEAQSFLTEVRGAAWHERVGMRNPECRQALEVTCRWGSRLSVHFLLPLLRGLWTPRSSFSMFPRK